MDRNLEKFTFTKRLKSMLNVDFKRLFSTPLFYILIGISLAIPILILVMTSMMEGTVTNNPQTGLPNEPIEGFDYVWQIFGGLSGAGQSEMTMDLVSMCNVNMMFFGISVLVCLFVCDDFKSGYSKNLFTVRSKKSDYVISKTLVCSIGSAIMFIAFFIGSLIGGVVSSIPFTMDGFDVSNIIFCMLSKICLIPVFVAIFNLMSVISKKKTWLAICLSLAVGMLLFMMIPSITPLDATFVNVIICLVASIILSIGLGLISNLVLNKTALV